MTTTTPVQRALNEADAARYVGVSRSTLRHGRAEGQRDNRMPPPPFVRLGRKIVYLQDDLDAWLQSHRTSSSTTAFGRLA